MHTNKQFRHYFNTADKFMDVTSSVLMNKYVLDIIKFDDWLVSQGYSIEKHGSMKDYINTNYGNDAEKFIHSLLG